MDFDSNFPLNPEYGITGKIKQGYVMSNPRIYEKLPGSEGLFTFNFLREAITETLPPLLHVMADHDTEALEKLGEITAALTEIGFLFPPAMHGDT